VLNDIRLQITNAIQYWEPRRLVYNLILAGIVLTYFGLNFPGSLQRLSADSILFVFLLAVLANIAYCAAYLVDIFVQISGYQAIWLKHRWMLLALGTLFAGVVTRLFARLLFYPDDPAQ
jgi:hypothetical protein